MKSIVAEIIKAHSCFEILTHECPDADAVGASQSLAHVLNVLKKQVKIVYPTQAPENMLIKPLALETSCMRPEVSLLVDVSDVSVLGGVTPQGQAVVIDHHSSNTFFGQINWVESDKSSASEMVYDLMNDLGVALNTVIASNIYMGIFSDTGGFMHSNTTPEVFEKAHILTMSGADATNIAYKLKKNRSFKYYKLLCRAVDRSIFKNGVCASFITIEDILSENAEAHDISGIVEELASIKDAELSFFIRDIDADNASCSIRSRNTSTALKLAALFGGGGHGKAAGFSMKARAKDIFETVLEKGAACLATE